MLCSTCNIFLVNTLLAPSLTPKNISNRTYVKELLDPKEYSLPIRTVIEMVDDNLVAIVINRKSRIIMADGKKIREKIVKIQQALPQLSYALKTTAPVCSKTAAFLEDNNIQVICTSRSK